jgi:hypothetical protein
MIPAFLSFDIEPDGFQVARPPGPLLGYDAIYALSEQLRQDLSKATGRTPVFGWYFRTDAQIADVYGRPDELLVRHPDRIARFKRAGDYFGVHPHPIRWCDERRVWVHDFADTVWLADCTRSSLTAFADWAGVPAERTRFGAGFLSNEVVAVLDEAGVKADLTLEPVERGELTHIQTTIDRSPMIGTQVDCSTAPRVAYRPAHHDFRIADRKRGRSLVLLPLSSTRPAAPRRPLWWRFARRLVRGPAPRPPAQMMYPYADWPSENAYWDLVQRELDSMRRPYLSLAIRTDIEGDQVPARIRRLFEALPNHPIAKRLSFVDPIEVKSSLL